jgi:DNA-binding Xre family transcriptional regulator
MLSNETASSEMLERYGEAFARALGVFVREVARGEQVQHDFADDETALLSRLHARAADNDRLEHVGKLQPIPFDSAGVQRSIAERIRNQMQKRKLSQAQLARALDITPANISRILKSPAKSKVETLQRLAAVLHCDVGDFFDSLE